MIVTQTLFSFHMHWWCLCMSVKMSDSLELGLQRYHESTGNWTWEGQPVFWASQFLPPSACTHTVYGSCTVLKRCIVWPTSIYFCVSVNLYKIFSLKPNLECDLPVSDGGSNHVGPFEAQLECQTKGRRRLLRKSSHSVFCFTEQKRGTSGVHKVYRYKAQVPRFVPCSQGGSDVVQAPQ